MKPKITLIDIAFVIVLYKVKLIECKSYISLTHPQPGHEQPINLIVYDNSPDFQNITCNNIILRSYYHDADNPGVSKAYNYGAKLAKIAGFKWIVLLDQDTIFPANFFTELINAINSNPSIKLFAPILQLKDGAPFSPSKYLHKRGYRVKLKPGTLSLKNYSPVNCGMTIDLDAFFNVGGYNEQVTLDFADFQFIERFRKLHDHFYLFNAVLIQDFSNEEVDIKKLQLRFAIYCICAKKCIRYSVTDDLAYLYSVLRHTIGLFLKTRDIKFFSIFFQNYLKGNKLETKFRKT